MEFLALCIRQRLSLPEFRYYVDNGVNVAQAVEGKEDLFKATTDFDAMINFLSRAGVPYHDVHRPDLRQIPWVGYRCC